MKTTKEKIKVMQAFEDGKEVEYINKGFKGSRWLAVHKDPLWNWHTHDYRTKELDWDKIAWVLFSRGYMIRYPNGSYRRIAWYNGADSLNLDIADYSTDGGETWQPCSTLAHQ